MGEQKWGRGKSGKKNDTHYVKYVTLVKMKKKNKISLLFHNFKKKQSSIQLFNEDGLKVYYHAKIQYTTVMYRLDGRVPNKNVFIFVS